MTVQETHVMLLEHALTETAAVQERIHRMLETLRTQTLNRKDRDARQLSQGCLEVTRRLIAAVAASDLLERSLALAQQDD